MSREPPLSPSVRVVRAVAEHEDTDPMDLDPPLLSVVDPDALDSVVADSDARVRITFIYRGYHVTVGPETVEVRDDTADSA